MAGGAVARLFVILGLDKSGFQRGAADARQETYNLRDELKSATGAAGLMEGAMQAAGIAGIAVLAAEAGRAALDLAMLGTEAGRVEDAFRQVAAGAGQSGPDIIAAMDAATGRVVDDEALMQTATSGMVMGLRLGTDEWAKLAEGARYHARLMGQDVEQVFAGIVETIARGQPRGLTTLGFAGARDAIREYGEEFEVTAAKMTEGERQAVLLELVMGQINTEMATYGEMTPDLIDATDELGRAWGDLKEGLGQEIAPVLTPLIDELTQVLGLVEQLGGLKELMLLLSPGFGPLLRGDGLGQIGGLFEGQQTAAAGVTSGYAAMDVAAAELTAREENLKAAMANGNAVWIEQAQASVDAARTSYELAKAAYEAAAAQTQEADSARWAAIGVKYAAEAAAADAKAQETLARAVSASAVAYTHLSQETRNWLMERTAADITSMDPYEMVAGQEAALAAVDQQREDNQRREEGRAERYTTAWDDAVSAQQQAYDDLRSTIQSALRPSEVTALDFDQSAAGTYADKWDENARRLSAIAENGFAELQKHADWAAILKIPPELLSGSEAALKEWAARTADSVRNLERPDLLNVDAALAAVQAELNRQAAVELSLDVITKAAIEGGLVTGEDAKNQVAQALGLETGLPVSFTVSEEAKASLLSSLGGGEGGGLPVPVTFVSAATGGEGGAEGTGGNLAAQLVTGIKVTLGEAQISQTFVQYMATDIKAQKDALKGAGVGLWRATEAGILTAMQETNYAVEFAMVLAPIVADWLRTHGRWNGGGGGEGE